MTQVNVTQEMIDLGGNECDTCPIRRAVKFLIKDEYNVFVTYPLIYITEHTQNQLAALTDESRMKFGLPTPDPVRKWLEAYDSVWTAQPISFTLDIPAQYLRTP